MKTYADQCLERAEKATEGPWSPLSDLIVGCMDDSEFIAHARTDVTELARRLKEACDYLRLDCEVSGRDHLLNCFCTIADELEAMPEEDGEEK
jgi:hypothetical protein